MFCKFQYKTYFKNRLNGRIRCATLVFIPQEKQKKIDSSNETVGVRGAWKESMKRKLGKAFNFDDVLAFS